ncbi:MAG: TlyA family RNA methyltransferase [Alphaproteobacteria bacterium]|jgi:23S rRNA (cytidine1920-2'-O)/16S rRNA (cytidine1409-2'-O)-methyltransferase|nr:TlyA family RNA methyltransferase [Alphaproteobacteria bacterium]PHX99716.1 MAG: TlyA family rRNA (cytidine-2'-O)-methyltransferase [Rhodospirillaceae bacterium]
MAVGKIRLDQLLVARRLADSPAKAQALIMLGVVYTGERKLTSAGEKVPEDLAIDVRGREHPWVSRGGMKLAHGLTHFNLDPTGWVCVDVGSSTGGFTDVLVHRAAAKVYAVDVGYGQLADKLRKDPRVVVLERTNARHLTPDQIPEPLDVVVCDASFIGLRTVLPAAMALTKPGAILIALIKPQFEVGRGRVGPKGVVRDPALHAEVCDDISNWLGTQLGWRVLGLTPSPITGPEGNVEFLIGARREA